MIQKKFSVFQIIVIELVAVNPPYYCKNTRRPYSTCQEAVKKPQL